MFFVGCTPSENKPNSDEFSEIYSSLIQQLKLDELNLIKYIKKGGLTDTIQLHHDSIDWNEELKMFIAIKIPKSVYNDYEITNDERDCEKQFQTSNNKHSVKNYKYSNCNGQTIVNIDVTKNSPLYEFDYHLEINSKGYLIEVRSDVEFAYSSAFRVEGKFIKENRDGRE